jgi:hypothetical protein
MALQDTLMQIAKSLQIVIPGSSQLAAGQKLAPTIVPDITQLGFDEVLQGDLSLTWLQKDIRFVNPTLEPDLTKTGLVMSDPKKPTDTILGGMPIPVLGADGVPGSLNQLVGKIPLVSNTKIPVSATISWSLHEDSSGAPGAQLQENTDFVAPAGLAVPAPTFFVKPGVVELARGVPLTPKKYWLKASVRLSVKGVSAPPLPTDPAISLPDVPFFALPLPLPTILAMFTHADFEPLGPLFGAPKDEGATLIVVPESSPLGSAKGVTDAVATLQKALLPLTSLANFVGLFVPAVDVLATALAAQPHIVLQIADQLDNLNDITLIQRDAVTNDTEAEDELSSLIFIGPANRQVELNNARDQNDGEGRFTLKIGSSFHAVINDLHKKKPVAAPDPGLVTINKAPGGDFGEISSLHFLPFP